MAVLSALLGLKPNVTSRTLHVRPVPQWPMTVRGLVLAGQRLTVEVDREGSAKVSGLPEGWRVADS